jgi:proliferating cell nuclear antigen PCNA
MSIFNAKTTNGFVFKIIAELLNNNIKVACFEIDKDGIRLRMMDHNRTILIDLNLEAEKFTSYKYKSSEKMYIGITSTHLNKMLKMVKKQDSIQLSIMEDSPSLLELKILPKDSNRITTSKIKIQTVQNLDIALPENYGRPITINSGEFQKMCKGFFSKKIIVSSKNLTINFASDVGGVMTRETNFGDFEEDDEDDGDEYNDEFDAEQLNKIAKITGLNKTMRVFPKEGEPFLIKIEAGSIGEISIFLKSKSLQEADSHVVESDVESDE